ncbi:hypothetical protein LY78DRAFT_664325 [Colletotrichum sublineola]|nr:hypothetical protein LY78DRAFT_664325 [Colletotrichum sublineola]
MKRRLLVPSYAWVLALRFSSLCTRCRGLPDRSQGPPSGSADGSMPRLLTVPSQHKEGSGLIGLNYRRPASK